jgi:hypothetical protein
VSVCLSASIRDCTCLLLRGSDPVPLLISCVEGHVHTTDTTHPPPPALTPTASALYSPTPLHSFVVSLSSLVHCPIRAHLNRAACRRDPCRTPVPSGSPQPRQSPSVVADSTSASESSAIDVCRGVAASLMSLPGELVLRYVCGILSNLSVHPHAAREYPAVCDHARP